MMENLKVKSPLWMDKEFFSNVIKHHAGNGAELIDFTIKPSLTVGEHFGSTMFRAEIKFSTISQSENVLSVVIKILATDGLQAEFSEGLQVFKIEQEMYAGPLNDIKSLLESIGDFSTIQPKLIYQSVEPNRVIVMEDLGATGYTKIPPFQPFENFEDSKLIFERLGKFHAASYFIINERKVDFSRFDYSIFHANDPIIKEKFLKESIVTLTEVLESQGGFEEYIPKLKAFQDIYLAMGQRLYEPDVNGYNVLNHGDFHTGNLMYKMNGDKLEDFYFLDFQICVLANPYVDLIYALYNHISDANRRARQPEIIHIYHTEFVKTLQRLGYIGKIPSLLDLQMDLLKHGHMEVIFCICFKLFMCSDVANARFDEIIGSPDSKKMKTLIFRDPRYQAFIKKELPRFVQMGLL